MAKVTIKKERRFDYNNEYTIDVSTTQNLNKDDYKIIVDSIKAIEAVLDPHINVLFSIAKKKGGDKK